MQRKYIFKNNTTGQEIVLPVTPRGFQIDRGTPVTTVDLYGWGEFAMPGDGMKLFSEPLEFLLPRQRYPFVFPDANLDPYYYVDFFQLASDRKQVCRFVVSGTPTICDVLIENLQYRVQDGTGDLYCTLTMHRYRTLGPAAGSTAAGATARTSTTPPQGAQSYTVQRGDTLGAICRKFYGDASLAGRLAAANGIANANIITVGKVLRVPTKTQL